MAQKFYASLIAICDLDPYTRRKVGGGIPTNNQAALQARLSLATPTNPITLVVDDNLATSTVILPVSGHVTVRGDVPGARIMAVPGTNGHVFQSELAPQRSYDPGPSLWKVIGIADFDSDGHPDLAWGRQDYTGEVRIWLLDGAGGVKKDIGLPPPAPGWRVIGIADFDSDGHPDLAWRRQDDTGEVRIWLLDGAGGVRKNIDLPAPAPGWKVIGIADFDSDGHPDLAWRRQDDTGEVRIWLLDGAGGVRKDIGLPPPAPGWKVIGVADFDSDGYPDLAWRRQDDTGEARIWLLDGVGGVKKDIGLPAPAPGWKVVGIADFDSDGHPDLAWRRQDDTGEVRIWLLDSAGGVKQDIGLPAPTPGWKVIGIADFDSDGHPDLAWRRQDDTGEVRIWLLDGAGDVKKDIGLPEIVGGYVRFESLTIDGLRNGPGYPTNSNVNKVSDPRCYCLPPCPEPSCPPLPPGVECWDARGRIDSGADGDGPWCNCMDLACLDIVELRDVRIYDAPTYGVRFNRCRRVYINGGGVDAPSLFEPPLRCHEVPGANTDGYHFDGGCEDVVISDVMMATGDDAIAINADEGLRLPCSRFLISNVVFRDCRTGVRLHGSGCSTHQVIVSNVTGTIRRALIVYGSVATTTSDVNHSLTVSHADVQLTGGVGESPTAMVFVLGNGGTLTLNDVKQVEPAHASPFVQFGSNPDGSGVVPTVSEVVLNDCAIYRNDTGNATAYVLEMPVGNIGTLILKNFRVTQQAGKTYSPIPYLLFISAPGSIDTLIVEGGHYSGTASFLNDPGRISHFGGTGLVATGLHVPAAKTLPGAQFLNADDRGYLYENIGEGVCVKLA